MAIFGFGSGQQSQAPVGNGNTVLPNKDRADYFRSWRTSPADKVKDWSLMGKYSQANAADHFKRALSFSPIPFTGTGSPFNPGPSGRWSAGVAGENVLNSLGFVTKNQKASMLNRALIPLGGAYMAISSTLDGHPEDYWATAAGFTAGLGAARPMAEIGHGVGKLLRMGGLSRILGYGLGGTAALAIGGAAYFAVSAVGQSMNANNFVQDAALTIGKGLMNTRGLQTNNTMTARQRALGKLARSGLNDRGSLLGNEAMVMRGML